MRGLDLAPKHAPGHAQVGDVERKLGRFDRARAAYRVALGLAKDEELVPIALRAARARVEDQGALDEALAILRGASERRPDARLHVRCGDLLTAAGRHDEAVTDYLAAAELRPHDAAIAKRLERAREATKP